MSRFVVRNEVLKSLPYLILSFVLLSSSVCAENAKHTAQELLNAKFNFFVGKGDINKVKELLNEGAEINYRFYYDDGRLSGTVISRPWWYKTRSVEMLSLLLSRGLNPNLAGEPGMSPLANDIADYAYCIALRPKDSKCINGGTEYYKKRVNMLLDFGADPNFLGNNLRSPSIPVIEAVRAGDFSLLKRLVVNGADINKQDKRGETALMMAAKMKNLDILDFLLDEGADIKIKDKDGMTVVDREYYPFLKSSPKVIIHLLDKGWIRDIRDYSLAYAAVEWKDHDLLEKVLSLGADPDKRSPVTNSTPLIKAIFIDDRFAVELLLKSGASPTLPHLDRKGKPDASPLELAETEGSAEVAQLIRVYIDNENIRTR